MNYINGYKEKYAILIGIDKYKHANNLMYATNDAQAIKDLLISKYDYKLENVELILDEKATKKNILKSYLNLINKTDINDSVIFFYAGHGHTQKSNKNFVGFLVPSDGNSEDINTLIRWDEFTRNADFIKAKHMFFIMDACYSGLAITRTSFPGSKRFLKDMLQRHSRQVLVAGKADQVVSDGNGPIPKHSIFTGHLIEGLGGKAKNQIGIITANGLMSYVYNKVSNDTYSNQTPHFGFIDGDGDFIININEISNIIEEDVFEGKDVLIDIPSAFEIDDSAGMEKDLITDIKELISEDKNLIKLEDLINLEIRKVIELTSLEHFPVDGEVNPTIIEEKILEYEKIIKNLQNIMIIICCWGKEHHLKIIKKIICMLVNNNKQTSGKTSLISLRLYPIMSLIYCGIISSLSSNNYESLKVVLECRVANLQKWDTSNSHVIVMAFDSINEIRMSFNKNPKGDKYYYPFSEYMFKKIQPILDDLLFLGNTYEDLFDIAELIISLKYVDVKYNANDTNVWGPQGRFAYKYHGEEQKLLDKLNQSNIISELGFFNNDMEVKKTIMDLYKKFLEGLSRF